jgi:tetratricopeptide (TPR) repeat protein
MNLLARRWPLGLLAALVAAIALVFPQLWAETSFAYHIRQARRELRAADPEAALVHLRQADDAKPKSAEVHFLLGVANRRVGSLPACLADLHDAEQLGWSLKAVRRQRLLASVQGGDKAAEKDLQQILDREIPDDEAEEIYEAFAKGYLSEFRLRDAKRCLDFWIDWRPQALLPRLLRAEIAGHVGDRARQMIEFQGVLSVAPDNFEAHVNIAELLLADNRVEEALAEYRWCLERRSDDPRAAVGMASCQRRWGNLAEARRLLDATLKPDLSNEQRSFVLNGLGQLALEGRDLEGAIELLSEAASLAPSDHSLRYSLGTALARAGQESRAAEELALAKNLEKQDTRLNELQTELVNDPNNAELRWEAAMILRKQERSLESLAWLFSALRCNANHKKTHAALADYYESQGELDIAAKHRRLGPAESTETGAGSRE